MTTLDVHQAQFAAYARHEIVRLVGPDARSFDSPALRMAVILDALFHHAQRPVPKGDAVAATESGWVAGLCEELTGREPGWIEAGRAALRG